VDYDEPTDDEMSRWMIEQETSRLLLEAIDRLPPRAAAVIRLTLEGVRQDEIGERMGITVATVKALKADGMHKLKKMLAGLCVLLGIV
jgi:RNA polymerase sigma-70 factor (ECF subfamily)